MGEAKHTPERKRVPPGFVERELVTPDRRAPWSVKQLSAVVPPTFHILGRDGFSIIATCYDRTDADRLAAAPDGYALAQAVLRDVDGCYCDGRICTRCLAEAFIAKAEARHV